MSARRATVLSADPACADCYGHGYDAGGQECRCVRRTDEESRDVLPSTDDELRERAHRQRDRAAELRMEAGTLEVYPDAADAELRRRARERGSRP